MGGSIKSSGNATSTSSSAPWAPQQPYLTDIFGTAQDLFKGEPPKYYPDATYATSTAAQNQALSQLPGVAANNLAGLDQSALKLTTQLAGGDLIGGNPAQDMYVNLAGTNLGLSTPGTPALLNQANNDIANPGANVLQGLAGSNPGLSGGWANALMNATNNGYGNPAASELQSLATTNAGLVGPWASDLTANAKTAMQGNAATDTLTNLQGSNPFSSAANTGANLLTNLGSTNLATAPANTGLGTLNQISDKNLGLTSPAAGILGNLANTNLTLNPNNATSDVLNQLMRSNMGAAGPQTQGLIANQIAGLQGTAALNSLAGSDLTGANPANEALGSYASGAHAAAGNPYTAAFTQNALSQVVPQIQAQFIQGGGLSSPEAARATSAGAMSAIAPTLANMFQQEEQNQIGAANTLGSQYLQGQGLRGQLAQGLGTLGLQAGTELGNQVLGGQGQQISAAQNLAGNILQAGGLQSQAAQALNAQGLQGQQNQLGAAQTIGNQLLQGGSLQSQIGQALGSQFLQGSGLQSQTAANLGSQLLQGLGLGNQAALGLGGLATTGAGLQGTAAGTLGSQALQNAGLQNQAALGLGNLANTGAGIQAGAAGTLGSQALQGAGLSQSAASTLGSQALQGQGLQQGAIAGLGNTYSQSIQDAIKGLAVAPTVQGMPYTDLSQLYSGGATQQGLNQAAINDAVARYNYSQTLPYQRLNQYIGQVTGNYGGTTTLNQPIMTNPGSNILGGALGGAQLGSTLLGAGGLGLMGGGAAAGTGAGLGALLALLSDRRIKEDIEEISELPNGLLIYTFRYIGSPMVHIGLMADEVEELHPEAVIAGPFGLRMVNYAMAVQ